MSYLMDTHVFIFWDRKPRELPASVQNLFDSKEVLYLSLASIWEMQIKIQLGKLRFSKPLVEFIDEQISQNGLTLLPITLKDIYALDHLPHHHRDPFDRLLVAQAMQSNLTLVTNDSHIAAYPIATFW